MTSVAWLILDVILVFTVVVLLWPHKKRSCETCHWGPVCYLGLERHHDICDPCDWITPQSGLHDAWEPKKGKK